MALVEDVWFDEDNPETEMQGSVGDRPSRSLAEQTAQRKCRAAIGAGEPAGTVERHGCRLKVSFRSKDARR